jgi:hypothetical protein
MAYSFLFSPSFSFFFFSSCCCHPTKYRNVGVCVFVCRHLFHLANISALSRGKCSAGAKKKKKDVLNPSAHPHTANKRPVFKCRELVFFFSFFFIISYEALRTQIQEKFVMNHHLPFFPFVCVIVNKRLLC